MPVAVAVAAVKPNVQAIQVLRATCRYWMPEREDLWGSGDHNQGGVNSPYSS